MPAQHLPPQKERCAQAWERRQQWQERQQRAFNAIWLAINSANVVISIISIDYTVMERFCQVCCAIFSSFSIALVKNSIHGLGYVPAFTSAYSHLMKRSDVCGPCWTRASNSAVGLA